MISPHAPTPEFRSFLETEITRSFQSEARIHSPSPRVRRHRVRRVATVLAAIAFGVLAGAAPTQVQDARQREQLITAIQAELQLAGMRLDLARTEFQDAQTKFEVGLIGAATLAAAEVELREMELAVARLRLNQEEVRATAAPPSDDLSAPVVGSRDFVSERLKLDLAQAQQRLTSLERTLEEVQRRERTGAASKLSLLEVEAQTTQAKRDLQLLAAKFNMRRDFLERDLSAQQVEHDLQRLELQIQAAAAREMQELSQQRLTNLRRLQEVGGVDQLEVKRAELEFLERQMELQRVMQQLQRLNDARSRP